MKRLVICSDGTWNERDQVDEESGKRRPTNVTKVARTVLPVSPGGAHQVVGYIDGVGTGRGLDKFTGGAFGDGVCENVVSLYRFILYNYVPGDELYFFGFSRGAFTVRTLVGFMNRVGIVKKNADYFVPEIFKLYETNAMPNSEEWKHAFRKTEPGPCPTIRFIGVWDTVGALGAPGWLGRVLNAKKYAFHDVTLNSYVENAFHAMAIDEQRAPFVPTLWEKPNGWKGRLEQAWFSGVHSNVGGSYKPDGAANEALHWIVEQAEGLGLVFDHVALAHFEPHYTSELKDSMTSMYRPLGRYFRPLGRVRAHGECIHESVHDRFKADPKYRPKNLDASLLDGPNALPKVTTSRIVRQP